MSSTTITTDAYVTINAGCEITYDATGTSPGTLQFTFGTRLGGFELTIERDSL
ncbi:hypothetical protein JOD54_004477 [Actinokineospora baliensis]|uniref:hypothetical protein n=1 Tax=Actinokineospora baliensis TaxID=547056 RepID=UPI00195E60CC|nr:hypothetical protein [Actinokineospora baliensis]MBM7774273.1 hypothetical protein [Actinokineospora baliensis]